jgi:hypothetical protein
MFLNIPSEDRDHFTPLGEASVCMPLRMMEKYLYPTIKLMQHLQEKGGNDLPGVIQTMAMYSFYLQGQLYPKQRAQEDLEVLKAATLTSDDELCNQVRSEVQQVDNSHTQMRNILYNLQKAVTLPEYDELLLKGANFLHERQEEIDRLIALYDTQHQADFTTAKFNASKLTMLSHLAQKQAIEALDLNIRLVEAYEQIDSKIEENTVSQILHSQHAMRVQGSGTIVTRRRTANWQRPARNLGKDQPLRRERHANSSARSKGNLPRPYQQEHCPRNGDFQTAHAPLLHASAVQRLRCPHSSNERRPVSGATTQPQGSSHETITQLGAPFR